MLKHYKHLILAVCFCWLNSTQAQASPTLLATGTLTSSTAGTYADLSGLTGSLENGVPGNLLGGFGSGLTWAGGNTFIAVPDRGPNAISYDSAIDDTVSYISRFQTISMKLTPNPTGSAQPFSLTPTLTNTTLLFSPTALTYGTGVGLDNNNGTDIGAGTPSINTTSQFYFTGRSDGFDPSQNSGNPNDARLDPEAVRLSNDGTKVFISDEYGPYIYEFDRATGQRLRFFTLPSQFYVSNLSPVGATEISGNTSGRTANKGLEGLAITPNGKTLVAIVQAPLLQDENLGGNATKVLRIVTLDIASRKVTGQYAYDLTAGTGVSDIVALNDHQFLVDERDGTGLESQNNAGVKDAFIIDLNGATDVSNMDGLQAYNNAVDKHMFFNTVDVLSSSPNHIAKALIPSKIEGFAIGPNVKVNGVVEHTLWVTNDNDFLTTTTLEDGTTVDNPNQFYVFGFTDADLNAADSGTTFAPQIVRPVAELNRMKFRKEGILQRKSTGSSSSL